MDNFAFATERLNVFYMKTQGVEYNFPRHVFVGVFNDDEWAGHVVCMTVCTDQQELFKGAYIDWIETTEMWRREGYARELVRGAEKFLNMRIVGDGASDAGEAFCDAVCPAVS